MDGWDPARGIKKASHRTPVVLLTGEGRVLEKVDRSDIDSALFKPFNLGELEEVVLRTLEAAHAHRVQGMTFIRA